VEWGSDVKLHSSNLELPMSLMGQKRTWRLQFTMSALHSKADIDCDNQDVCFGPISDISGSLAIAPVGFAATASLRSARLMRKPTCSN
jgi:hypothetical protein